MCLEMQVSWKMEHKIECLKKIIGDYVAYTNALFGGCEWKNLLEWTDF